MCWHILSYSGYFMGWLYRFSQCVLKWMAHHFSELGPPVLRITAIVECRTCVEILLVG